MRVGPGRRLAVGDVTAPGQGWPRHLRDLADWLNALPPEERYRVAKLLGDQTLTRPLLALTGYGAIHAMAAEPGVTRGQLAERLALSVASVDKGIFRWRQAVAGGECIECGGPGPAEDMCDACASSVVLEPPEDDGPWAVRPG